MLLTSILYLINFNIIIIISTAALVPSILILFLCVSRKSTTSARHQAAIKDRTRTKNSETRSQTRQSVERTSPDGKTLCNNNVIPEKRILQRKTNTPQPNVKIKSSAPTAATAAAAKRTTKATKLPAAKTPISGKSSVFKEDLEEPSAAREASAKEEKPIIEHTRTFSWTSNQRKKEEPSPSVDDFDRSSVKREGDLNLCCTQDDTAGMPKPSVSKKTQATQNSSKKSLPNPPPPRRKQLSPKKGKKNSKQSKVAKSPKTSQLVPIPPLQQIPQQKPPQPLSQEVELKDMKVKPKIC